MTDNSLRDKCFVCDDKVPVDSEEAIDFTLTDGERAVVCSAGHWSVVEQLVFEKTGEHLGLPLNRGDLTAVILKFYNLGVKDPGKIAKKVGTNVEFVNLTLAQAR